MQILFKRLEQHDAAIELSFVECNTHRVGGENNETNGLDEFQFGVL